MNSYRLLLRHSSTRYLLHRSNSNSQHSTQFPGFRCHFGTSGPLEQLLGDPKRTLSTVFHPSRAHTSSGLTSACNVAGHTHRLPCRFFGSAPIVMQRNPKFSTINSDDITNFKEILGEKNVVQDEERLLAANTDWMRKYKGSSSLVLQPRTTEEVSRILKYCSSRCLAVVPQGGNTGLVGGSVPVFDENLEAIGVAMY